MRHQSSVALWIRFGGSSVAGVLCAAIALAADPPDTAVRARPTDSPITAEAAGTLRLGATRTTGCGWAPGYTLGALDGPVHALNTFYGYYPYDSQLAVGGDFVTIDGTSFDNVAVWNGSEWSRFGSVSHPGTDGPVYTIGLAYTLETEDPCLGGSFSNAVGYPADNLWFPYMDCGPVGTDDTVWSIAETEYYGWPYYIGGDFITAGGSTVNYIAECDLDWSPLETGTDAPVYAIHHDGWGSDVIVGGGFWWAGSVLAESVARWDGSQWSVLSGPSGTGTNDSVFALAEVGGSLYAGGAFTTAGGIPANHIARWDGTRWWPLEGPSGNGADSWVMAMTDDGAYAGGWFTTAGGVAVNHVAHWTSTWEALASPFGIGTDGPVYALKWYDDGNGPALYAGGDFTHAGGLESPYLAKWVCESVAPTGPDELASTSHEPVVWSPNPVVDVVWSGATDFGGSGLAAYSFLFDDIPSTLPDEVPELFHSADPHAATSGTLGDGSHWFHLLAMDGAGNQSGGLNLGPFQIDTTPPQAPQLTSSSHTPGVASPDPTVDVSWLPGGGDLSGIDGYGTEVSEAASWTCDHIKDLEEDENFMTTAPLPQGDWYVHVCAVDNAGNWSAVGTIGPFVIMPGLIFEDDFESGGTSVWSLVVP
jgi:hypothetical protein